MCKFIPFEACSHNIIDFLFVCLFLRLGIAMLYLHLHSVYGDPAFLQRALEHVDRSLRSLTQRWVTFLCGDAGPLAVAAVIYHRLQRTQESEECINRLRSWSLLFVPESSRVVWLHFCVVVLHIPRLMQYYKSVVKGSGSLPNELLYGRVGYLFSLIFINQQFQQEKIPAPYIQQVSRPVTPF